MSSTSISTTSTTVPPIADSQRQRRRPHSARAYTHGNSANPDLGSSPLTTNVPSPISLPPTVGADQHVDDRQPSPSSLSPSPSSSALASSALPPIDISRLSVHQPAEPTDAPVPASRRPSPFLYPSASPAPSSPTSTHTTSPKAVQLSQVDPPEGKVFETGQAQRDIPTPPPTQSSPYTQPLSTHAQGQAAAYSPTEPTPLLTTAPLGAYPPIQPQLDPDEMAA